MSYSSVTVGARSVIYGSPLVVNYRPSSVLSSETFERFIYEAVRFSRFLDESYDCMDSYCDCYDFYLKLRKLGTNCELIGSHESTIEGSSSTLNGKIDEAGMIFESLPYSNGLKNPSLLEIPSFVCLTLYGKLLGILLP